MSQNDECRTVGEIIHLPERQFRDAPISRYLGTTSDVASDADVEMSLSFSSEFPVERSYGYEILGHGPGEIRLDWLSSGRAPVLVDHDARMDSVIGVVRSVAVANGVGRAVVRFNDSSRARETIGKIRQGSTSVSVGYRVHAMAKIGERDGVATYRVRDWEPLEVSIVAVPADPSVAVGRSADAGIVKIIIEDHTMTTEKDPAPVPVTETRAAAAPASPTPEQIEATVEARMAAELKRREEIEAIGARFNLPVDMRSTAIRGKMTVEAFRGAALDWVGEHQATEISLRQAGVGLTQREAQSFSLLRLVDALADPGNSAKRKAAAFEFEACEAAGAKHGRAIRGQVIPVDVLAAPISGQRDLVVGTATAGGNMVATNLLAGSFIELLRNRSMVTTAGARMLAGLQGTIAIPRQSGGATAYWVAENTAVTESDQTIAQLTMSPKTVGAMTDVSRRLLINATPSIEQLVREDLAMTLAIAIDRAALYGTGTTQPVGISNAASITAGVNAVTIADVTGVVTVTYAEYVDMETQVAIDNADFGSLGYMLNQAQRGQAKLTEKFSTTGQTIWEPGNTINGYPVYTTNQVTAGDVFFGNWADLLIGMWSGIDLLVDPYTGSAAGTVRMVAHQDVDVGLRQPVSFSFGT